jgi:ribosomal protein S27AE
MAEAQYTCPMHPEVVRDKPGKCPKCGMALVAKEEKRSR